DIREHTRLDAALGADRLAGLERDELRELLDVVVEDAATLRDHAAALAPHQLRPALLRLRRRPDGGIDVLGVAVRRLADFFLGGGIDDREGAAGDRAHHAA